MAIKKPMKGNAMSMDNTRSAIGRRVPAGYLPTVREPLPEELRDLVVQLVAFEAYKRQSGARPAETLQLAPDARATEPSARR